MSACVDISSVAVGSGAPCFIIAEIGINHNGDIEIAKSLIDAAADAGCNAVKFQKRTPELCVPKAQRNVMRETPWGMMTYMDYRYRVEFDESQYAQISRHCDERGVMWFASCWDVEAVRFMESFNPPCYKVASASITDTSMLAAVKGTGRPVLMSTGMSTLEEVDGAVSSVGRDKLVLFHCNSTYPAPVSDLNLRAVETLRERYDVPVGYSGHEVGLQTTVAAVALGASAVERHITLDRAMWGTDQAASVEPHGFIKLVRDIRAVESALGDGVKVVYDTEIPIREKLRSAS